MAKLTAQWRRWSVSPVLERAGRCRTHRSGICFVDNFLSTWGFRFCWIRVQLWTSVAREARLQATRRLEMKRFFTLTSVGWSQFRSPEILYEDPVGPFGDFAFFFNRISSPPPHLVGGVSFFVRTRQQRRHGRSAVENPPTAYWTALRPP